MNERCRRIHLGTTYRLVGGKYDGRLAKAVEHIRDAHGVVSFVKVNLLDGWGRVTKQQDLIAVKYFDL